MPPLLAMNHVSKRFDATQALEDVSFEVATGQVRALIGENGAGKSTLMKILAGVHRPDSGSMTLDGRRYEPSRPAAALRAGVAMIHQELSLAPHLTVEQNIMLGQERSRLGWISRRQNRQRARAALARLSRPDLPLDTPVEQLPAALGQVVEIARALVCDARVLVFDEPTSSLSEQDAIHLFACIRQLRQQGLGIVYISHFLEEVAEVGDVYTVLRDGRVVGQGELSGTSRDTLVRMMVGRELRDFFPRTPHNIGEPLLTVEGLAGNNDLPRVDRLILRRGEILGIAGLVGSGRTELVRSIYGLRQIAAGEVRVATANPTPTNSNPPTFNAANPSISNPPNVNTVTLGKSPRSSIQRGVGFVSEDRAREGLALNLSIADNLTMTRLAPFATAGVLNIRKRDAAARDWIARTGCKSRGADQPIGHLSGGNQQKIAIARLLHQQADVLLLDEPTRGIDVATKAEVYRMIGELAAQGKAILLVSSYLPELLGVCDTLAVMCRGKLSEVRPIGDWTEESIMHLATGGEAA